MAKKPVKQSDDQKYKQAIKKYEEVFDEINRFTDLIREQDDEIVAARLELEKKNNEFLAAKKHVAELEALRDGAQYSLYVYLRPGVEKILPLFDQMDPADDKKHGRGSNKWRKDPVSAIRISLPSVKLLNAADIMFVGQLQDKIQAEPHDWWKSINGLTEPIAAAIVDRLNEFLSDRESE